MIGSRTSGDLPSSSATVDLPGGIRRRTALKALAGSIIVPAIAGAGIPSDSALAAEPVQVTDHGIARAVIVVPDSPDEQIVDAVADLVRCIKRASGATLQVVTVSDLATNPEVARALTQIRVGIDQAILPHDLDEDGYVIRVGDSRIVIVGPSHWGTRHGVNEFLERYVGVQWLWPGPDGEDVPTQSSIKAGQAQITEAPQIMTRVFSNLIPARFDLYKQTVASNWGYHQRMRFRTLVTHMLYQLVPSAKYGISNPEFYPLRHGKRFIPGPTIQTGWQPRLSAEGVAAVAAQELLNKFVVNQGVRSWSLGVNDGGGFSQDEVDYSKRNSLDYYDMSELYYTFVNEVVSRVAPQLPPDTTFGVYAYREVLDPPSFRLHPQIVLFLTTERYGWVDPALERQDKELTRAWLSKADHVGWYDYTYGGQYCAPRYYPTILHKAYTWAKEVGVSGYYAEAYPAFAGEGPKPWHYTRMVWGKDMPPGRSALEWSQRAVGRDAGALVAAHFQNWEEFWTTEVPKTGWFNKRSSIFGFPNANYITVSAIARAERSTKLLDRAVALAANGTADQRSRMAKIRRAFDFYDASIRSYPVVTEPPNDRPSAITLVDWVTGRIDASLGLAGKRADIMAEFVGDPALELRGGSLSRYVQQNWTGWNLNPLWDIVDYIVEREPAGGPVRSYIESLAISTASDNVRRYLQYLITAANGGTVNRGQNMSFESEILAPWTLTVHPTVPLFPVSLDDTITRDGTRSMAVPAGGYGTVAQNLIPVGPGPLNVRAYVRPSCESRLFISATQINLRARAANSALLRQFRTEYLSTGAKMADGWYELRATEMLPDGTTSLDCEIAFETDVELHVDSVTLTQLNE